MTKSPIRESRKFILGEKNKVFLKMSVDFKIV